MTNKEMPQNMQKGLMSWIVNSQEQAHWGKNIHERNYMYTTGGCQEYVKKNVIFVTHTVLVFGQSLITLSTENGWKKPHPWWDYNY